MHLISGRLNNLRPRVHQSPAILLARKNALPVIDARIYDALRYLASAYCEFIARPFNYRFSALIDFHLSAQNSIRASYIESIHVDSKFAHLRRNRVLKFE